MLIKLQTFIVFSLSLLLHVLISLRWNMLFANVLDMNMIRNFDTYYGIMDVSSCSVSDLSVALRTLTFHLSLLESWFQSVHAGIGWLGWQRCCYTVPKACLHVTSAVMILLYRGHTLHFLTGVSCLHLKAGAPTPLDMHFNCSNTLQPFSS